MWNLSKQAKEKFAKCNTLPIPETDEEWEMTLNEAKEEGADLLSQLQEELEEVKAALLQIVPTRFIPYIENGTLNQLSLPKSVRDDYLQWMREADKEFEQVLDAAYEQTEKAISFLSTEIQDVFAESLHDSIIERIKRDGNSLHLYINTDSGFSSKALIHLMFEDVISEESDEPLEVGQWIIYNELQKTEEGFAFRVLFECPDAQWTIAMRNMDAQYYYRPALYTILNNEDKLAQTTFEEYTQQLNPDLRYWLCTPHFIRPIKSFSDTITLENGKVEFNPDKIVVSLGDQLFTYEMEENNPISFIYTDKYENPYAQLNEPLPFEKIEVAALGKDLELQVRAWNTMYANPEELTDIINHIFSKLEITEENKMLVTVYVNHFYQNGVLSEVIVEKYRSLIG